MPLAQWPEEGCTLAEARERTADREIWKEWRNRAAAHEGAGGPPKCSDGRSVVGIRGDESHADLTADLQAKIDSDFRSLLRSRRLVAYGRLRDVSAEPRLITADFWTAGIRIVWDNSAVGDDTRDGVAFYAVRVFPALLAVCRVELLAGRPLSEAFRNFVLEDPEVVALSRVALKIAPHFERVFCSGGCYVQGVDEWPTAFEGCGIVGARDPDCPSGAGFLAEPDAQEVVDAAAALEARYGALMNVLRRGELEGKGLQVVPGHSGLILRSVWSHADFFINGNSGDVFEVNRDYARGMRFM